MMRTYERKTRSDLGLSNKAWAELKSFLNESKSLFKAARKREDIEMRSPTIRDGEGVEKFDPAGWVGTYPGEVTVTPEKFPPNESQNLRNDVAGWLEILGPGTANALLPYLPEEVMDQTATLKTYSRQLIEYTEAVLAGRPPIEAEFVREQNQKPRGRPLIAPTIRQRAQGSQQIVSQRIDFTFETLPNLLLIQFHAELARQLQRLAEISEEVQVMLGARIAYHSEFTESGLPEQLFDKAMSTDFTSPKILSKTRQLADDHLKDIIDLWEAYLENIAMQTDLTHGFETTVKPISKLYELWVLRELLDVLEELTGDTPEPTGNGLNYFRVGEYLRLQYDTSIKHHSRYLAALGSSPGNPDFALEKKEGSEWQCVWIGDAKYKNTHSNFSGGGQRFLRYLADCLPASPYSIGTLFCAIGKPRQDIKTDDYTIEFMVSRPKERSRFREQIQNRFNIYGI